MRTLVCGFSVSPTTWPALICLSRCRDEPPRSARVGKSNSSSGSLQMSRTVNNATPLSPERESADRLVGSSLAVADRFLLSLEILRFL
uniref:Putative secreted protein n=1 Tax=Anopheles darlingi TaxID=43151 RepID=A0A2M4DA34_ANODA